MSQDTVNTSSNHDGSTQPPTIKACRCSQSKSVGARLNISLEIADEATRKTLIDEAFVAMCDAPKGPRRDFYRDLMMGLIEGRPDEDKARLERERLIRITEEAFARVRFDPRFWQSK